ncbi:MAG: sulfurtransferase TusA family protein [Alphaproteobacteria bacterium]|nr:sulfurtransferase TusA family protein [Alphaproteobacteria bacterium]
MDLTTLDARGLTCPLPVLKARKLLQALPPGGRLRVLATDPGAVGDFHALCEAAGHTIIAWNETDRVYTFDLEKKAG